MNGLIFQLVLPDFKFYLRFPILTDSHLFLEFSVPNHLDLETLSLRPAAYVSTVSVFFLASLVMLRKNIPMEWFGRGNICNISTRTKKLIKIHVTMLLLDSIRGKH